VGWRSGFDSGESLDHVYRNRAEGNTPIGRMIDRIYLDAIGWRGIRQRKANLQQSIRETIGELRAAGTPVFILDVAAGPGRYLLELLAERRGDANVSAVLRDVSAAALDAGRGLASEMNLSNVRYELGDAFIAGSLASVQPRPNLVIVSGL